MQSTQLFVSQKYFVINGTCGDPWRS